VRHFDEAFVAPGIAELEGFARHGSQPMGTVRDNPCRPKGNVPTKVAFKNPPSDSVGYSSTISHITRSAKKTQLVAVVGLAMLSDGRLSLVGEAGVALRWPSCDLILILAQCSVAGAQPEKSK
jgi:hypothetical protein